MILKTSLIFALVLGAAIPLSAGTKKKDQDRAMLEKMEAVPCGAKEKGLSGLGSLWGSAGITHMNTDEKLCPQYLVRTDDMEYLIRPTDKKHPVTLPVGHEVVIKIKKDKMVLKVADSNQKAMTYQVVAMKQNDEGDSGPKPSD